MMAHNVTGKSKKVWSLIMLLPIIQVYQPNQQFFIAVYKLY